MNVSNGNHSYVNGQALSKDMCSLIIDKMKHSCISHDTVFDRRGVMVAVAHELGVDKSSVSRIWKKYCLTGTHEDSHNNRPSRPRKLDDKDVDYIRQLVLMKPTIYKSEIWDLVLENTNSPDLSVSLSTVTKTVIERISDKRFTQKKTQRSNKKRWTETNMTYTRNFLRFIRTVDSWKICFVDEVSANQGCAICYYGTSEIGSRAVDVSTHHTGPNYTIFCLIGMNDKCYVEVDTAPSDGPAFINFIHNACQAHNTGGEPMIEPGTVLLSDCASIHSGYVQTILQPYLEEMHVSYYFLPKFSCDTNPTEFYISEIKTTLQKSHFQAIAEYSLPLAILTAAETIPDQHIYNFFKNVSLNYMNL